MLIFVRILGFTDAYDIVKSHVLYLFTWLTLLYFQLSVMDHHRPPGYGQQDNYMYGDPSMGFPGNNEYMYGAGRPMSPPPGDEEVQAAHDNLPSALEEVLAYKEHRAREVGHSGDIDEIGN